MPARSAQPLNRRASGRLPEQLELFGGLHAERMARAILQSGFLLGHVIEYLSENLLVFDTFSARYISWPGSANS